MFAFHEATNRSISAQMTVDVNSLPMPSGQGHSPCEGMTVSDKDEIQIPVRGRLLGIDFGTKRVGVAVSDTQQVLASPLNNYQRNGLQADERFFRQLAAEYEVAALVVGLPLHMSGDESGKCKEARAFGQWLQRITKLPVTFHDERFSSLQAEALLLQAEFTSRQRKARIDKVAAQILLQAFLDSRSKAQEHH